MRKGLLSLFLAFPLSAIDMISIPAASREAVEAETGIKLAISTQPFLIAATETTQADYESLTGVNPSLSKGPRKPVENVTWFDAIRFTNLRSARENLTPCYDLATARLQPNCTGYRLPTDAEWESAAAGADPQSANLGSSNTKDTRPLLKLVLEKGSRDVASSSPSSLGLHDMLGNVWEWTTDFWNPHANAPQQTERGLARIIRGGSFISTRSNWNRGYRSSIDPAHKSRFLGFRVARSLPSKPQPPVLDSAFFAPYNQPPAGFETSTGDLTVLAASSAEWQRKRPQILDKWRKILGAPKLPVPAPAVRLLETHHEPHYTGRLMMLQVEPDFAEKIYLMTPRGGTPQPRPVIIVPYYDIDTPAGRNLGGRSFMAGAVRHFAHLAVQRGFIAVAIRWFGESYGERYDEAVANLAMRHPGCTGLGKWVWDSQRLLDYLHTLPQVDRSRIAIIGHSLGAKMALYAAAMDDRIKVTVASEGGIGFKMSNYEDFWYLGETIRTLPPGTDQHELLALLAPRPFLLIGGDEYDGPQSWHFINSARKVYDFFRSPTHIGYFNHHSGHSPTPDAVYHGFRWLSAFLAGSTAPSLP